MQLCGQCRDATKIDKVHELVKQASLDPRFRSPNLSALTAAPSSSERLTDVPRPYPTEFRARAIALVRAEKPQNQTARDLGIHPVALSKWLKQGDVDRGLRSGVPTSESAELRAARRRIHELETELSIVRQAGKFLGEDMPRSKALPGDRPTCRRRGHP
ncbi:transposase [Mycobacterium colombiense]